MSLWDHTSCVMTSRHTIFMVLLGNNVCTHLFLFFLYILQYTVYVYIILDMILK